jgi:hypothetical protein
LQMPYTEYFLSKAIISPSYHPQIDIIQFF